MRTGNNAQWLEVDGKIIGISLGADFCAEHEWGIQKLKRALGIDGYVGEFSREKPKYTKPHGLARRTIAKHDLVKFYQHNGASLLICKDSWWFERFEEDTKKDGFAKAFKNNMPHDLQAATKELSAAWDGESFGILARGEDAVKLGELYEEFRKDRVAIWVGGRAMAFENGGLIVCMVDKTPADKAALLKNADLEAEKLSAADDATGIVKRLEVAKKTYHALSPRWKSESSEKKTAYPVVYWLNPAEQDENNYGWFTVEELDQWILGKGPIPKSKETAKRS